MCANVIIVGVQCFEEQHWHNDVPEGLTYDNVLWGYLIQVTEEMYQNRAGSFEGDPVSCVVRHELRKWAYLEEWCYGQLDHWALGAAYT